MSSFIGPQSAMAAQEPGAMYHWIGYDLIYTDQHGEEWIWISGDRMPPPHTCFAVAFGHTFHAVMSSVHVVTSVHAVSHFSSCHFMLLVTVSHTRMRCCMSDSLRTEIRACVYGISHRIYPITYLTTGIWSDDGASHESFSHACQITLYSHCSHVQSLFSHCTVCHSAWHVLPIHQLHVLVPTSLLCPTWLLASAHQGQMSHCHSHTLSESFTFDVAFRTP